MNVLIYSPEGDGTVFAQKLHEEGHDVIVYIKAPEYKRSADGLLWKTNDPDSIAADADLIIFDGNGCGEKADEYRKKGYVVWNGGSFNDQLEHDRKFGMKVFKEYGIPIPDTYDVSSVADVKSCLASEFGPKEKLVIKLDGADAAGSSFTFTAHDPAECLEQVTHWDEDGLLPAKWSGIIQRFVDGVEVSTEAWFCECHGFTTHNITLEEKKILAGNLGPSVGCAYNTIVRIDESSRLFKLVLAPLEPLLRKMHFCGQIDTNAIVDPKGVPHALEFTPRCGYEATPTLAWGNNHGFAHKINMLLGLEEEDPGLYFGYKGLFWAGVRVYIPPYPFESMDGALERKVYETCLGVPILNYEKVEEDFYLYDAMKDEKGKLVCAGTAGIIGIALGGGDTIDEAAAAAYAVADRIEVPNKSYRINGEKRSKKAWDFLTEKGMVKFYRRLRELQAA